MAEFSANTFYYGDNLEILRKYIPDNVVDLIYLDPPFNSQRAYNILFKEADKESTAQIQAFEDTWKWNKSAEDTYYDLIMNAPGELGHLIDGFLKVLGRNDVTAYLVMMAIRLVELHRVLKKTGSIYLHCDPTASHYLKVLMDVIFGKENFRNEIIWHYRRWTGKAERFQKLHDIILFYSKTNNYYFNAPFDQYTEKSLYRKQWYHTRIKNGEVYKTEINTRGVRMGDVWTIPVINSQSKERLGYPTQKPLVLLERIIKASSKKGDIVLDPFCGCGTTVAAAQKLGREWLGIDITHLAINLMKNRMKKLFPKIRFQVAGEPTTLEEAKALALQNRFQFEWWALSLVGAQPMRDKHKGADKGIDGIVSFFDNGDNRKIIIIQVKSGHVQASQIRDLKGVLEREKADIGVLMTLEKPTEPMIKEALSAGVYKSSVWGKNYPKIQILTIKDLFNGAKIQSPPQKESFKNPKTEFLNTDIKISNLLLL